MLMRARAMPTGWVRKLALAVAVIWAVPAQLAAQERPGLQPCRLPGVEHEALCGVVRRPLDPAAPADAGRPAARVGQGDTHIDVHFAVLPALARNRKPDPVLFFAGGPGQSAMELAGPVGRMLARLGNRRDVVLIDQRGTGRSAPLACERPAATAPLSEGADLARQSQRLLQCAQALQKLPHGDLRHYTTWVAMQDAEAVRLQLGVRQVNLVGGSYGTRAALDYMRQFPQAVRRVVIDGVVPPDRVLPQAASADNQAALDAVWAACEADSQCKGRYPDLRAQWQALLKGLPRTVTVLHPVTGVSETFELGRAGLLGLVRTPLYVPVLASGLPLAVSEAAQGRWEPLVGLASAMGGRRQGQMFEGMHFAVMCSEDVPRLAAQQAGEAAPTVPTPGQGADFADSFAQQYRQVCSGWPRGPVPAAFYNIASAPAATLVLSGGADPVTPPHHGEHAAKALGAKARHVVVAQAGHGVMGLACMRDVLFRFIDADSDEQALQVDADCAKGIPRPPAFVPVAGAPK